MCLCVCVYMGACVRMCVILAVLDLLELNKESKNHRKHIKSTLI